jgi:hypothetical protein
MASHSVHDGKTGSLGTLLKLGIAIGLQMLRASR